MWVFLYYMLNYFQIILIDLDSYTLKLEVNFYQLLILDNLWVTYISLQLLWGGFLSRVDVVTFFKSLFSLSGIALLAVVILFYYYNGSLLLSQIYI